MRLKMKILMISSLDSFIGGEGVYITEVIKSLREEGHNVLHIVLDDLKLHSDLNLIDNPSGFTDTVIIPYNFQNRAEHIFSNNLISFNLYKQIRRQVILFNPDIIHLHKVKLIKTVLLASRGFPFICSQSLCSATTK